MGDFSRLIRGHASQARQALLAALLILIPAFMGHGAEWGTVRMTLTAERDADGELDGPELAINSEGRGLKNVVAWVHRPSREWMPDDAEEAEEPPVIRFTDQGIEPRITVARRGQRVQVVSETEDGHAPTFAPMQGNAWSLGLGANGDEFSATLETATAFPTSLNCNFHADERAYIFVCPHRYAAASNADGEIVLANVPTGACKLRLWHELGANRGWVDRIIRDGEDQRLERGTIGVWVEKGDNDVGEIVVFLKERSQPGDE